MNSEEIKNQIYFLQSLLESNTKPNNKLDSITNGKFNDIYITNNYCAAYFDNLKFDCCNVSF